MSRSWTPPRTAVAFAYGDAFGRATGWRWIRCLWRDQSFIALASRDEAHAHMPLAFIAGQMERNDVATLLLFNMPAAGQLPEAGSGQLSTVG